MQEFQNVLRNEHLNRFAGLLAIAQEPHWRARHPEVASARGRLDQLVHMLTGGESFDVSAFNITWVKLVTDIVHADPKLSYSSADLDWFYATLENPTHARMVFTLLFAVASDKPRYYTAEQLAQYSGLSSITWRKRALNPDWLARQYGQTWLFSELILRACGVVVPPSAHSEDASSESDV